MLDVEFEYLLKYSIECLIGTGSFGSVFLATEKHTSKKVALKICPVWSNDVERYIFNEILILSLLESPLFPKFYHSESYNSFFVMEIEYCPGQTLLKYLQDNPKLDTETIIHITHQMMDALFYLHSNSIVHRDLKLENIIISDDLNLKICDFGFSTFFRNSQKLKDFCGSSQYCSPEMTMMYDYDGPSNDIWTLGICILKLCIGLKAFNEISDGKFITGYYSIFEMQIPHCTLRTALKRIFVHAPSKRASLLDLYKIFEFPVPVNLEIDVVFADPIILEKMRIAGRCPENIYKLIRDKTTPEHSMYKLFLLKTYFSDKKSNNLYREALPLLTKHIRIRRGSLCCYESVYIDLVFYTRITTELFLEPSQLEYSILKPKIKKKTIFFTNRQLVVEYHENNQEMGIFKVSIRLVCGDFDDFCQVLYRIITEFVKNQIKPSY